jgi:uncharacterized protein (DUF433 family)
MRQTVDYQTIVTIDPSKRGGRPTIRCTRITVADVLGWLAAGMTANEILSDYPELTGEDTRACLACTADRERRVLISAEISRMQLDGYSTFSSHAACSL